MNNQKIENPELRALYLRLSNEHHALAVLISDLRAVAHENNCYLRALAKGLQFEVMIEPPETHPIQAGLEIYELALAKMKEAADQLVREEPVGSGTPAP